MKMFGRDTHALDCTSQADVAVLRGVMRLASVEAYDRLFSPIRDRLQGPGGRTFTVDLSAVPFMNSSGIRALASLVLIAKQSGTPLRLVGSGDVPWQKKTFASFQGISRDLETELR
jgi:hypothetical protein